MKTRIVIVSIAVLIIVAIIACLAFMFGYYSAPTKRPENSIKIIPKNNIEIATTTATTTSVVSNSSTTVKVVEKKVPTIYLDENVYIASAGMSFKYPSQFLISNLSSLPISVSSRSVEAGVDIPIYQVNISSLGSAPETDQELFAILAETTVYDGSGEPPKSLKEFKKVTIGPFTYYKIRTGRFEGVLSFAYYLVSPQGVLKFTVSSRGIYDWAESTFDEENEYGHRVLKAILGSVSFSRSGSASNRTYFYKDFNTCTAVDFVCPMTEKYFMDSTGCGCEKK